MKYQVPIPNLPVGERSGPFELPPWGEAFRGYIFTLGSPDWPLEGDAVLLLEAQEYAEPREPRPDDEVDADGRRWARMYSSLLGAGQWYDGHPKRGGKPVNRTPIAIAVGALGVDGDQMIDMATHPEDRVRFWVTALRPVTITLDVEGLP